MSPRTTLTGSTDCRVAPTFQKAAAVHCVSEAMKIEALQYGLSAAKARVIRPAVDPDFFRPGTESRVKNRVLSSCIGWVFHLDKGL